MMTLLFIFLGVLALSILVMIHEFGHFLAARFLGVKVEAFSVGWGPVLFKFPAWQTEFRLSLLPLGGYCKMRGDQDLQNALEKNQWVTEEGSFFHVPAWRRLVISLAGPLFNFFSALLLLVILSLTGYTTRDLPAQIYLQEGESTPALDAGLKTGDIIRMINQNEVYKFEDVQSFIRNSDGKTIELTVERDGQVLPLNVTPRWNQETGRWFIGIAPYYEPLIASVEVDTPADRAGIKPRDQIWEFNGERVFSYNIVIQELSKKQPEYPLTLLREGQLIQTILKPELDRHDNLVVGWRLALPFITIPPRSFIDAIQYGFSRSAAVLSGTLEALRNLFSGRNLGRAVSGPIQTTYTLGQATALGLSEEGAGYASVIQLFSFLSLVLFIMNLLPIPGLDGGHIIISLFEIIRRRRLSPRSFMNFQKMGFVFIVIVLILAILTDFLFVTGLG